MSETLDSDFDDIVSGLQADADTVREAVAEPETQRLAREWFLLSPTTESVAGVTQELDEHLASQGLMHFDDRVRARASLIRLVYQGINGNDE